MFYGVICKMFSINCGTDNLGKYPSWVNDKKWPQKPKRMYLAVCLPYLYSVFGWLMYSAWLRNFERQGWIKGTQGTWGAPLSVFYHLLSIRGVSTMTLFLFRFKHQGSGCSHHQLLCTCITPNNVSSFSQGNKMACTNTFPFLFHWPEVVIQGMSLNKQLFSQHLEYRHDCGFFW